MCGANKHSLTFDNDVSMLGRCSVALLCIADDKPTRTAGVLTTCTPPIGSTAWPPRPNTESPSFTVTLAASRKTPCGSGIATANATVAVTVSGEVPGIGLTTTGPASLCPSQTQIDLTVFVESTRPGPMNLVWDSGTVNCTGTVDTVTGMQTRSRFPSVCLLAYRIAQLRQF